MKKHILTVEVAQEEWKATAQALRELKSEAVAKLEEQERIRFRMLLEALQEAIQELMVSSFK